MTLSRPHNRSPGPFAAWISALRPRTLVAGVVPVAVGTALAIAYGLHHPPTTLACVGVALLLQVAVNLHNDYEDGQRGTDDHRLGPERATSEGWLAPASVLRAAVAAIVAATILGAYLVSIGGWPFVVAGLASIAATLAYTGGPVPLGYRGCGELLVFIFFGLIATAGTFMLHTGVLTDLSLWSASAVGSLAAAILVVNNLRDRKTDAASGKRTLAVILGPRRTRIEYALLIGYPYAMVLGLVLSGCAPLGWLLPLLSLPLALRRLDGVWHRDGRALNRDLAQTAQLELIFGLLLAVGVLL